MTTPSEAFEIRIPRADGLIVRGDREVSAGPWPRKTSAPVAVSVPPFEKLRLSAETWNGPTARLRFDPKKAKNADPFWATSEPPNTIGIACPSSVTA